MKQILSMVLVFVLLTGNALSQGLPELKLTDNKSSLSGFTQTKPETNSLYEKTVQLKKRKTVTSYFGAGYSFMIFTNGYMSSAFPVFDTRNGSFLTNINLFFGFAIAKAVTLEIEPTILFTSNNKVVDYKLSQPYLLNSYGHTTTNSLLAFPLALNVRFFPFFKLKSFARLFFIGGGAGVAWIREENDIFYNSQPVGGFGYLPTTQSTSQWAPVFKPMIGFTGTGGQFGFGGEVRYNIIPLKQDMTQPFATRFATNFNSVDITLRFYFSL